MTRRSAQATRGGAEDGGVPFWAWLGLGVAIGVGLSALALYQDWVPALRGSEGPSPNPRAAAAQPSEAGVAQEPAARAPDGGRASFDFYQILPEMEVVVPDREIAAQAAAGTALDPTPAPVGGALYLQAGSFRSQADAEQLKARLALSGERASVVPVTINGVAWFRVRVGPYTDPRALDHAKRQLAANGIDAIALRQTQ